jgi:hypothetical protein
LRLRLGEPPPDDGLWSSRKVGNWMTEELGLKVVAPQRGRKALKAIGSSIKAPRPKNLKSASPKEAVAFKKSSRMRLQRRPQSTPTNRSRFRHGRAPHRPNPLCRVSVGERPIAHGYNRFDWLYVTAFASPAAGETFWYLSNGMSKKFFEALLETFAIQILSEASFTPARKFSGLLS